MKRVIKPWGDYEVLTNSKLKKLKWQVKTLHINPNEQTSLQSHKFRDEWWVIVSGKALIEKATNRIVIGVGATLDIPKKTKHRISCIGKVPVIIVEVQLGINLSELDITRYEDIYGRKCIKNRRNKK